MYHHGPCVIAACSVPGSASAVWLRESCSRRGGLVWICRGLHSSAILKRVRRCAGTGAEVTRADRNRYLRRCPQAVVPRRDDRAWSGLQPSWTVRQRGSVKTALRPSSLTPEAVATPHHAPPLVRAGLSAQVNSSQVKSSQVKSSQVKSCAMGRGWCPHLCDPRGPRRAGDRQANEPNAGRRRAPRRAPPARSVP